MKNINEVSPFKSNYRNESSTITGLKKVDRLAVLVSDEIAASESPGEEELEEELEEEFDEELILTGRRRSPCFLCSFPPVFTFPPFFGLGMVK